MSTRYTSIYLFLIIGLLAISGHVAADELTKALSDLSDPYPRYARIDSDTRDYAEIPINDLMVVRISHESLSGSSKAAEKAATEQVTRPVPASVSEPDSDYVSVFDPDAMPYLPQDEHVSDKEGKDEESDSILFFTNIEKLITVDSCEDEADLSFAATDPILAILEGEYEESETLETKDIDWNAVESAVSVASAPVDDIPVYTNKRINSFIHMYTRKKRAIFEQAIDRSGKYMVMINRIFKEYELPPNLGYLAVVESNFNPFARSRANALGMWQFMKNTGRVFNLNNSWWHDDRYDPEKSTVAAAKYLKRLHKRFNGDWELALAAYNSGSGTVRRAIRRAKRAGTKTDFWSLRLPRETRGYVPAFYAVVTIFDNLESYGFTQKPVMLPEVSKQQLMVAGGISLKQIAKALDINRNVLSEMNPSLRKRGLVPPTFEKCEINIPGELVLVDQHYAKLDKLAEDRLSNWKTHTVKQGETLWSISRYYKIPVQKILAFNRFRRKNLINIGQKLMLPVATTWVAPVSPSKTKLAKKALEKLPGVTHVHKVQKGDTLWKISNKYNIPIKVIKYWNRKVLRRRVLRIGTEIVLKLPANYTASST